MTTWPTSRPAAVESPFRAMFTEMFESDEEYRPIAGDTVAVTFDKDHKVAFDRAPALRARPGDQEG